VGNVFKVHIPCFCQALWWSFLLTIEASLYNKSRCPVIYSSNYLKVASCRARWPASWPATVLLLTHQEPSSHRYPKMFIYIRFLGSSSCWRYITILRDALWFSWQVKGRGRKGEKGPRSGGFRRLRRGFLAGNCISANIARYIFKAFDQHLNGKYTVTTQKLSCPTNQLSYTEPKQILAKLLGIRDPLGIGAWGTGAWGFLIFTLQWQFLIRHTPLTPKNNHPLPSSAAINRRPSPPQQADE